MNTALVLVPDVGEPLVVRAGETVPQARTANYRDAYFIDTADHLLELKCRLPSSENAFLFNATVRYRCRVSDPAVVVRHSYTDVGAVLAPLLTQILRATTRDFDPDMAGYAEQQANQDVQRLTSGLGFSIGDCVVELALDSDEADYKRKLRNTRHTVEVEATELKHVMPYVESGDVGMLALYIAKHRDQAGAVLELLMARDSERGEQLIEAMKVVFAKSDPDDDFDIEQARTKIVTRVADEISGVGPGSGMLSLGRGNGRLRGTLLGASNGDAPGERVITSGADPSRPADRSRPDDRSRSDDGDTSHVAPPDPDTGA
jgi:hypothetical protein